MWGQLPAWLGPAITGFLCPRYRLRSFKIGAEILYRN